MMQVKIVAQIYRAPNNKIRRIHNHRHLPKYILNAKKRRQDQA